MIRVYKYRAFAPRSGRDAFFAAVALKRAMWGELVAMQEHLAPRLAEARLAKDAAAKTALNRERTGRIRDIRRAFAARGLAWGDYNAIVFQFDSACRASAARGALPGDHEGATGEAVVRQLQGTVRPHALLARDDVCLDYLPPGPAERRRAAGSRRSRYRTCRMDFQVRTDLNPAGAAALVLDFVMHRPLPANTHVVEVRILRTMRPVIRKGGLAAHVERWHVTFAVRVDAPAVPAGLPCVGVALDWSRVAASRTNMLTISRGGATRAVMLGKDHLDEWNRSRELFALADDEPDAAAREALVARARIFRRRIEARRLLHHRTLAASIAHSAAAVAIQAIVLAGKGVKNFTAPALFHRELRRAVENAGGLFVEVKATKKDFGSTKKQAAYLEKEARAALFNARNDEIAEAAE